MQQKSYPLWLPSRGYQDLQPGALQKICAIELLVLGPGHVQVFWKHKCFGNQAFEA